MLKVKNLDGLRRHFADWLGFRAVEATMIFRGLAAEMMLYMIHETPQYSGKTVSNWRLSAKTPLFADDPGFSDKFKAEHIKGVRSPYNKASGGGRGPNFEAMDHAIEVMRKALHGISLKDPVFITNATPFDATASVTDIIEKQPSWLRDENVQTMIPVAAASFVRDKYEGVLNALHLAQLTRMAV